MEEREIISHSCPGNTPVDEEIPDKCNQNSDKLSCQIINRKPRDQHQEYRIIDRCTADRYQIECCKAVPPAGYFPVFSGTECPEVIPDKIVQDSDLNGNGTC